MTNKLYVGGLSYSSTEDGLRHLFGESGGVNSVSIISDRETGRSKGFGFIEMATSEEAQAAIKQLDGREFDGRRLTVNEARPQTVRESRGSSRDR